MPRSVPLLSAALFAAGAFASPAVAQEDVTFGSEPSPSVAEPAVRAAPLDSPDEPIDPPGGQKPAENGAWPTELWGGEESSDRLADPAPEAWSTDEPLANPYGDPVEAVHLAPAAIGPIWGESDGTEPPEVPGAASVEPVLRCVYRPHPTRVAAVYEFLRTHAATGVDVSLRYTSQTGDVVPASEVEAILEEADEGAPARRAFTPRFLAADVEGDVRPELVIVAPAETQRAIGLFLQLALSEKPAVIAADPSSGFRPVERQSGDSERDASPLQPYQDSFGAAPPRGDANDFEEPTVAEFDDFGPPADPSDLPSDFTEPTADDFGGEFGDHPADRTTRRPVPRDE